MRQVPLNADVLIVAVSAKALVSLLAIFSFQLSDINGQEESPFCLFFRNRSRARVTVLGDYEQIRT